MVYFIASLNEDGTIARIKIGHTNRTADNRVTELETGNPMLSVLGVVLNGTEDLEDELHEKFDHLRMGRIQNRKRRRRDSEWFRATTELKTFIETSIAEAIWPFIVSWPLPPVSFDAEIA